LGGTREEHGRNMGGRTDLKHREILFSKFKKDKMSKD
jgi:hypothetical protein